MPLRVAELETLFTANVDQVEAAEKKLKQIGDKTEKNPLKVDADAKGAIAGMDRVEAAAKRLVSRDTITTVDANIERGEKNLDRVQKRLDYLHSVETTMDVKADIARAEASLSKIQRNLDGLKSARATMEVDANTAPAEAELKELASTAKRSGERAGAEAGGSLVGNLDSATRGAGQKVGAAVGGDIESTIIDALAAIPIAGGIVLGGYAIGKAIVGSIQEGLGVEVNYDRLQALTGISAADALRLGRAAGEAYANNFGTSIESNMDVSRLALQFHIIDPKATTRDAQEVVQGLAGIADVLDEDVRPTAVAVGQLLRTGLARNARQAFDILAAGTRNGVNASEDLLDTFTEYPVVLSRLGIDGPEAMGLLSQAMKAGARNSDVAADALKEFQIRATDASQSSAAGFEALGFDAEAMTAKIARGGKDAREGLEQVLAALRQTEDPVARNAAAVALFGTKAEDLGDALFAMDLSTAARQLDGVAGSAEKMFNTLNDNDASKMEQAQRNIEVAVNGIQGALAVALSEPLSDLADWVSQNRGPLTQFLLDLANGAIDFGRSMVVAAADGVDGFGDFVGAASDGVEVIKHMIKVINPLADTSSLEGVINGMREFNRSTETTADSMRTSLLPMIDDAKGRLNDWGKPIVALGYVNDATLKVAEAIDRVGYAADGATPLVDGFTVAQDGSVTVASALGQQIRNAVDALQMQLDTAAAAGESQDNLTEKWHIATGALIDQLTQMGLTEDQARDLIQVYGAVPAQITTALTAETDSAQRDIDRFIELNNGKRLMLHAGLNIEDPAGRYASGAVVEFMAGGGVRGGGLSPMGSSLAQMVPANTWRVVGDRGDVPEAFIPLDGSSRSWALLFEAFGRMPGSPGSGAPATPAERGGNVTYVDQRIDVYHPDPDQAVRILGDGLKERLGAQ